MGMSAAHCQGISECLERGLPVDNIVSVCILLNWVEYCACHSVLMDAVTGNFSV